MPTGTQTTTNQAPPWSLPYWGDYLQGASQQTQRPYTPYGGTRVADFSPEQYDAFGMINDRAHGAMSSADYALQQMYGGGGGTGTVSITGGGPSEPMKRNYLADPAQLDDLIKFTNNDVTRDYSTGIAAQNDARAARGRAFGGSAYEEGVQANQRTLADRLAGNASGLRFQDLQARRGLEESALGRDLTASEGNSNRNVQASIAASQAANQRAQLGLQAAMAGQSNDRYNLENLMRSGSLRQMYGQQLNDVDYGNFQEEQNYPWQQTDRFGQAISRASGNQGTQTTTTQQPNNAAGNWLGGGLGALALYSMFRN